MSSVWANLQDEEIYEAPQSTRENEDENEHNSTSRRPVRMTRSGRRTRSYAEQDWEEDDDEKEKEAPRVLPRRSTRVSKSMRDFVASDDDEEEDDNADYAETVRVRHANERAERARRRQNLMQLAAMRNFKRKDNEYADTSKRHGRSGTPSSSDTDEQEEALPEHRSYSFRARKKVNYSLLPPPPEPLRDGFGRRIRRGSRGHNTRTSRSQDTQEAEDMNGFVPRLPSLPYASLPRSMQSMGQLHLPPMPDAEHLNAIDEAMDSSGDEMTPATLGTTGSRVSGTSTAAMLENPAPATTGAVGSSTDTFGRLMRDKDPLADVDPLGVNMDIDFDQIGGLEQHVKQLKEMVSLPLLYPEVFQRFGVTPPRGVLFHGPPGTGKTLVARALAASCSTEGQRISFFMRKGADCLSKWVGEAERQLRLLFEEAKRLQPSIIFFDEIDGLAPVRSSKQDQIHASIVSTLLALMDGMDGRGQVIVIGATNRPDSIDPALRRPGRFDREFYFPLPNRAARRSILDIHTRHWDPPLDAQLKDVLAEATSGYGGADLRALCTEATLNAIQRRYPQIYQTNTRLLLAPETIQVNGRDFMLALEGMVPSSARASTSSIKALPIHLVPLLGDALKRCQDTFMRLLPKRVKSSALEEAMYEVDTSFSGTVDTPAAILERELLQQSFVQAQVYRPRLLLHGEPGMGQRAVAEALLHAAEGYHVRTLSAAALLGDSSQTPEAILVQQFQEAKRLLPSILYVPDLDRWPPLLSESVREMLGALLHDLDSSDTIMLFATSETPFQLLPKDIQAWFGVLPQNKFEMTCPTTEQRRVYLSDIGVQASRPPTQFADALPRRPRVLEELPKAPPRPPRMPTQAELTQQVESDARVLEHLKFRLGSVLAELRKKYKKFTRDVWDEYNLRELMEQFEWHRSKGKITIKLRYDRHPARILDSPEQDEELHEEDLVEEDKEVGEVEPVELEEPEEAIHEGVTEQPAEERSEQAEAAGHPGDGTEQHQDIYEVQSGRDAQETPDIQVAGQCAGASVDEAAPVTFSVNTGGGETHHTPDPEYIMRDLTIYTMTLDKIQRLLYQNQYLTCDAFMDDIQKIVSNAEVASEVDADRMFRAHQMQNLAKIMLDQYVDATFRAECQQMASRVMARREAEQREQQAQAQRPNGQRYSARVHGEEPEAQYLVDVSEIERAHKRARLAGHEEVSEHGDSKRPKVDEAPSAAAESADEPAASVPPPPTVLLSDAAQASLIETLTTWTDLFTVEQLEIVRATCYERILAHRSTWDRSVLVQELEHVVHALHDAVHAVATQT